MDFTGYVAYFESILKQTTPPPPYDNPDYMDYARLNWSRMQRWLKTAVISPALHDALAAGKDRPVQWIVITEPWCGDAAHIVPFLHLAAEGQPHISVSYELRDAAPFRINDYLTNGSKSIPKLVIRDAQGNDLATWGPRPAACQELYNRLSAGKADLETLKTALQQWYNKDKGVELQKELAVLVGNI
jgi:hypothetical protein